MIKKCASAQAKPIFIKHTGCAQFLWDITGVLNSQWKHNIKVCLSWLHICVGQYRGVWKLLISPQRALQNVICYPQLISISLLLSLHLESGPQSCCSRAQHHHWALFECYFILCCCLSSALAAKPAWGLGEGNIDFFGFSHAAWRGTETTRVIHLA